MSHPEIQLDWHRRPREVRNLLNPAFCGLLLLEAVNEYAEQRSMPVPLSFLILPLVLHGPTREALPSKLTTPLAIWVAKHPTLIFDFSDRVKALRIVTREALMWSISSRLISIERGMISAMRAPLKPREIPTDPFSDFKTCILRTRLVGRWLATSGDSATIYRLFGLRP